MNHNQKITALQIAYNQRKQNSPIDMARFASSLNKLIVANNKFMKEAEVVNENMENVIRLMMFMQSIYEVNEGQNNDVHNRNDNKQSLQLRHGLKTLEHIKLVIKRTFPTSALGTKSNLKKEIRKVLISMNKTLRSISYEIADGITELFFVKTNNKLHSNIQDILDYTFQFYRKNEKTHNNKISYIRWGLGLSSNSSLANRLLNLNSKRLPLVSREDINFNKL